MSFVRGNAILGSAEPSFFLFWAVRRQLGRFVVLSLPPQNVSLSQLL